MPKCQSGLCILASNSQKIKKLSASTFFQKFLIKERRVLCDDREKKDPAMCTTILYIDLYPSVPNSRRVGRNSRGVENSLMCNSREKIMGREVGKLFINYW